MIPLWGAFTAGMGTRAAFTMSLASPVRVVVVDTAGGPPEIHYEGDAVRALTISTDGLSGAEDTEFVVGNYLMQAHQIGIGTDSVCGRAVVEVCNEMLVAGGSGRWVSEIREDW